MPFSVIVSLVKSVELNLGHVCRNNCNFYSGIFHKQFDKTFRIQMMINKQSIFFVCSEITDREKSKYCMYIRKYIPILRIKIDSSKFLRQIEISKYTSNFYDFKEKTSNRKYLVFKKLIHTNLNSRETSKFSDPSV